MGGQPTRRELLRGGGALMVGGASAMVASGSAQAAAPALGEAQAITHALQLEQVLLIAYEQVLGSGVLTPAVRAQLTTMHGQEIQHVSLLKGALARRGVAVPPPPSLREAEATLTRHAVPWSLTRQSNQHDSLKLLVDVESLVEYAYFEAVSSLTDLTLLKACAEIMGCEAQHWTVLSGLLNHQDALRAVPYPFVEGTP